MREHIKAYCAQYGVGPQQRAALRDIARCRTAALGGHREVCDHCGWVEQSYNSCRNRNCPKCQGEQARAWLERRMERVLPTHYFHVVFTMPAELRVLVARNRAAVFSILLGAAGDSLIALGRDPKRLGAQLGVTAVLHTWSRDLSLHPHVHCIVTGGGLTSGGDQWQSLSPQYAFPNKVLGALFRGKVLAALARLHRCGKLDLGPGPIDPEGFDRLCARVRKKSWVTYAKSPFGGPEQVLRYLANYTHRVGISNARLRSIDAHGVTFATRGDKTVTLPPLVFLRRFLQHVLPARFVKIRHYGLHASGAAAKKLEVARALLQASGKAAANDNAIAPPASRERSASDPRQCPRCRVGLLVKQPLELPGLKMAASMPTQRGPP